MRNSFEIKLEDSYQQLCVWVNFIDLHSWMVQTLKIQNEEPVLVEKSVLEGLASMFPEGEQKEKIQSIINTVDWTTEEVYYFFT